MEDTNLRMIVEGDHRQQHTLRAFQYCYILYTLDGGQAAFVATP
jgi:hypothetical protein